MTGKLIIAEGVNGAGKTTVLTSTLEQLPQEVWTYNKGFTNNSSWDTWIHTHPHSLTYYIDLVHKSIKLNKTLQESNVLQDRYIQTVDSFLPDAQWNHNKLIRKLFHPFFLPPNLYIHITASLSTIVSRLKNNATDPYRLGLAANPKIIEQRENKYLQIYNSIDSPKYLLDTTDKSPNDCSIELLEVIRRNIPCW